MLSVMRHAAVLAAVLIASASSALAGEVVQIKIKNLAFSPSAVTVRVGDTVEWINSDFIDHTATGKAGEWDIKIAAGQSASRQLTHAGTIEYFCTPHPHMKGTIHVVRD